MMVVDTRSRSNLQFATDRCYHSSPALVTQRVLPEQDHKTMQAALFFHHLKTATPCGFATSTTSLLGGVPYA